MILNDADIRKLSQDAEPPLLAGAVNFDVQLQPAGFDVTVRSIATVEGAARLGVSYEDKVPAERQIEASAGLYRLRAGLYLIHLNEVIALPLDVAAVALPRSTLIRCGALVSSGLWDPGFHGRGRLGLLVAGISALEIERNAPFAQLVFIRMDPVKEGFKWNDFYEKQ